MPSRTTLPALTRVDETSRRPALETADFGAGYADHANQWQGAAGVPSTSPRITVTHRTVEANRGISPMGWKAVADRPARPVITALPGPTSELTRRQFIGGGVAAGLLLAGCTNDEPSDGGTSAGESWSFTDDRREEVTLETRPQQIVMQEDVAGALLPYGIRPTGVFGNAPLSDSPQFQAGEISGIEELGAEFGQINLEQLAAHDPDVILVPCSTENPKDVTWLGFADEKQLAVVREIAPIVAINVTHVPYSAMMRRFEDLARSLGADLDSPELVQMREEFDAASEELAAAARGKAGLQVMATSPTPDLMFVAGPGVDSELLEYERAGLKILDVQVTGSFEEVSWERVSDRPADVILIDARPGLEHGFLDNHPIWPTLPAVRAGQVGNWYVGTMYRMPFFTEKLRELAAVIDGARDIV